MVRPPDKGVATPAQAGEAGGWFPEIVKRQRQNPPALRATPLVRGAKQDGFTLLAMLLAVAATGAVLAAVGELASHALQREKEAELLFVGDQYRQAIASFHRMQQSYPKTLQELLHDNRSPVPRRHLRKPWRDPVTGQPFVLVEAPGGGVMGVHSASQAEPVKTAHFLPRDEAFTDAKKYADWKFVYAPLPASTPGK